MCYIVLTQGLVTLSNKLFNCPESKFSKTKAFPNNTQIAIAAIKNGKAHFVGIKRKNDSISSVNNQQCVFDGYDINPDAINAAKKNSKKVNFFNEDFINLKDIKRNLIIAADVFVIE